MNRHAPWHDGAADFSIGLKPIAAEQWFEGGEDLADIRARKTGLLESAPERVWAETPASRPGQLEAAALIGEAIGRPVAGEPPLLAASLEVADDLCLMQPHSDGWLLTALSLSAGTFFTAADVVGKSLEELHGPVPGFSQRLLPRVTRIFDRLAPDTVLQRRNWTVVNSDALHLPDSEAVRAQLPSIDPELAAEHLFVRVERQTLRRLPRTGSLLFTIRIWRESLTSLAEDEERLASFARAWESATSDFRTYKRLELYDPHVHAFLRSRGFLRRASTGSALHVGA